MSVSEVSTARFPASKVFEETKAIWFTLLLAAGLRLYQLGAEGVWIDEMYSMDDAIDFDGIGIRPLYYLLLKVWLLVDNSDAWLRSLSVLLDLGAIFFAYKLCEFTLGRTCAVMTALIMALSPLMINHAQEIRMYPLISCLTVGGSLAMAHALEKPSRKNIVLWAIARLLALLTSPLMLLMLVPDFILYGLTYWRRWPQLKAFLYGLIFIGAAWLPLFLQKFFEATQNFVEDHSAWQPDDQVGLKSILSRLGSFTVFSNLNLLELLPTKIPELFYIFVTLVLWGVLLIGIIPLSFDLKNRRLWLVVWLLAPFLIQLGASVTVLSGTIWKARYLLYLAPYFMMLLSYGLIKLYRWQPKVGILIGTLYLVAVGGGLVHYYSIDYRPPWNDITDRIESQELSNDIVVNYTWMGDHNIPRYYDGQSEVYTIHIPRNTSAEDRLQIVRDELNEIPQSERLWMVCQSPCQKREGFEEITRAIVGDTPKTAAQEDFSNVVDAKGGQGSIELLLLESN